mmetsp:Transcript_6849/g.10835  ORF Transcript_6849/g.10835 Transcript_6849/m.10835 type:complete len:125 (-) Transcript_6849:38-412(-)
MQYLRMAVLAANFLFFDSSFHHFGPLVHNVYGWCEIQCVVVVVQDFWSPSAFIPPFRRPWYSMDVRGNWYSNNVMNFLYLVVSNNLSSTCEECNLMLMYEDLWQNTSQERPHSDTISDEHSVMS